LRIKEFSSFDVAAVVRELKEVILNSRVSNIYQLDSKTLIFKFHKSEKPPLYLVLESGKRLHLTSYMAEKPFVPPAFCMALRKYLRNCWLSDVEQYEFERVVIFHFKAKDAVFQVVLELFGEGNIILVDGKSEILQALVYKRMRDRNILRGEAFVFAPSGGRNPFKLSKEDLQEGLKIFGDVEVVRAIARFLSIGGIYAEEILLRANVDKIKLCKMVTNTDLEAIFNSLQELLSQVKNGKLEPCIVVDNNGMLVDVLPLRLKRYEDAGFKLKFYTSFNEALDEFYIQVSAVEHAVTAVSVETEKLKREVERLKRVIEAQEKALIEAKKEIERNKRIGDVIYAHAKELQILLDKFLVDKKGGKDWSQIVSDILAEKKAGVEPWAFFESFEAKSMTVYVCVDDLNFGLNLRKSIFENASEFYERGKRVKQKFEGAKTALEDTRSKLFELESKIGEAEKLKRAKPAEAIEEVAKRKVKHKEWFEKFRWFISSDGFLVVAGKDAVSNEVLIKKYTESNDIVFHANISGAPFVVVKTEGKEHSETVLREAGEFAAAFSRGWREGYASVDVYWVKPEQLGKGGPSGEYVPHGAFVVSGKRNWMRNVPLKIAVGVVLEENGEVGFVGGPVEAVKAKAKAYVTIVPGGEQGKELVKRVLKVLAAKVPKELREKILKASIEQVRAFIPYSMGRIVES